MPKVDLIRDVDGYAEAARREEELRAVPFLGVQELIAGLPVAPLTLRKLQWLTLCRSPFLLRLDVAAYLEKPGVADDVVQFLWIASEAFEPGNVKAQKRFYKTHSGVMNLDAKKVIAEILEYLDEALLDGGGEGGETRSYYSIEAGLVSFFHSVYGLQIDVWENSKWRQFVRKLTGQPNVLDIPLRIAFQLVRVHRKTENPDLKLKNRLSDPKIETWLNGLNQSN